MDFKYIKLETENSIARLILNRPEVLNALNLEMVTEIAIAVKQIGSDKRSRVLIIYGEGENFAAGADISPMLNNNPQQARVTTFNRAWNSVETLGKPVIAAISGYALGGGLELALACDIRICGSSVKIGLPEIKLGIFPGAGGTQRLPKIIGAGRAREMILTGCIINASKALDYGLCTSISEGDPIDDAVEMAGQFIKLSSAALGSAKRVINFGMNSSLTAGIQYEEDVWSSCFSTDDQHEGMKAFIEKRKPNFTGK